MQARFGCVPGESVDYPELSGVSPADGPQPSFYPSSPREPKEESSSGCATTPVDRLFGYERVQRPSPTELGIPIGGTTPTAFSLERTACIGMSDHAPAALVNETPVTERSDDKAREIVAN
ncbi:MAG: NAD(P)H-dependent oxidoreductase subunit E [Holophagales bacterium]|nr:NAD(P)H-dependent oxidoreductase subunit E [Holophagales bacterium]